MLAYCTYDTNPSTVLYAIISMRIFSTAATKKVCGKQTNLSLAVGIRPTECIWRLGNPEGMCFRTYVTAGNINLSRVMSESSSQEVLCRVCHCGGEQQSRLIFPCKCNGSMKYVHELCLLEWMNTSGQFISKCEICAEQFRYKNVYSVELAKRSVTWEVAGAYLKLVQTFLRCLIYLFLPVFARWWFLTSFCMIFDTDDVCSRSTTPLMTALLFYFGNGIANLATVSIWILLLYITTHKIFMELCGARETYLVYALRKRLADKAARWAILEEACIQQERRNFAFADFESMRVEWEYEKEYVKEVFAARTRAKVPLPVNPDEDELVVTYNCDIAFCHLALEQLRVAHDLGAGDLVVHFHVHYTAWLKMLKHNKQYFIDHFQKFRVSEQQRREKLRQVANRRYRRMVANTSKMEESRARSAGASTHTQTAAASASARTCTQSPKTDVGEGSAATPIQQQANTADDNVRDTALPDSAEYQGIETPAEPIVFKIEKTAPAPMHPMMDFNSIMMVYGVVVIVGIALVTLPAAVGRTILFIRALNQPLTIYLQRLSVAIALYFQHLVYGVLTMLDFPSPQTTVPQSAFQEVARYVCGKLRTAVEYALGYAVYSALMCLCGAVHVAKLYAHARLDGPLSEMTAQYIKYFVFRRSQDAAQVTVSVLLYLVAAPAVMVLLLGQLDHCGSSCIHTSANEHVVVAYRAISNCIFAALASCLLVYALQVCEDFQRELGSRFPFSSPWASLTTGPTSGSYYLQLFKSFAMVCAVALLFFGALIVLPLTAARVIIPAVRRLTLTADPGAKIIQWLFLLVFTRCVVRKLLVTRSAAWFAHWMLEYFLMPASDSTSASSADNVTAVKQSSWLLRTSAWARNVYQRIKTSNVFSISIGIALGMAVLTSLCTLVLVHPLVAASLIMRCIEAHTTTTAVSRHSVRVFLYYPAGCIFSWILAYTMRFLVQDITRSAPSVVHVYKAMLRAVWMAGKLLGTVLLWTGVPPLLVGVLLHELVLMPLGYGLRGRGVPPCSAVLLDSTLWKYGFLIITTIMMGVGIAHDSIIFMVTENINKMLTYKHMVSEHIPTLQRLVEYAVLPALFTLMTPLIRPQYVWVMCYIYPAYMVVSVLVFVQDCVRAYLATMHHDLMDAKYLVGRQLKNCNERNVF